MFTKEILTLSSGRTQTVFRGGSGAPLLWLHSLYGFDEADPVLRELVDDHEVVAPVAPGFTDVAELDELPSVHDLALHYDDILEAAGLARAPVVGHSFGAMLAAELAAHRPDRVERLALLSPLGLWHDDYPVADLFGVPYTDVAALLFADPARSDLVATVDERGERDVERLVTLAKAMTTVAKFLWPIPDRGLHRRLHRIVAPTLILHGQQDAYVPARYADDFAAALPNARREIISDAGHMVHREQPEAVTAHLAKFLAENPG